MSTLYTIKLTEDQLRGLRHAAIRTELEHQFSLPQLEKSIEAFASRQDERFLAMARENLANAHAWLSLVKAAIPALYRDDLGARKSSPPPAGPSPSAAFEAVHAITPPDGNDRTVPVVALEATPASLVLNRCAGVHPLSAHEAY